jgi:hypothetical protein
MVKSKSFFLGYQEHIVDVSLTFLRKKKSMASRLAINLVNYQFLQM